MVQAMKAKDQMQLNTIRGALTSCTNFLVEKGKKPDDQLTDEEVTTILKRLTKQRKESALQYRNAGDETRAAQEDKEREILEAYLPEEMPEEEVRKKVQEIKAKTNEMDRGKLIGAVMQELKGKADGAVVAKMVNEELQA